MRKLILIAHNLRSTHNVGSLLRTADGLGVSKVYLTGYTPYPRTKVDTRLPHLADKIHKQIQKTSLGAESSVNWEHYDDLSEVLNKLRQNGNLILGLEQNDKSIALPDFKPSEKLAIIVGREVDGLETEALNKCDVIIEIPMFGKKESFNVVQAAAMAFYHCRFYH